MCSMDILLIRCTYMLFFLLYCASISPVYSYETVKRDVQNLLSEQESQVFYIHGHHYPRDCSEVLQQCTSSNKSGVHLIQPGGYLAPFEVYCSNDGTPGGWTVIQRRLDASINFNRQWDELKNGFGFLGREFWLGNDKMSYLTNQADYELQIDLVLSNGSSIFINYNKFRITDEWSNYTLIEAGDYSGNADNVTTTVVLPKDCYDLYTAGNIEDGVYTILPPDWPGAPFDVLCNMTSDGGGWTVFQRQIDGSTDFYRDWESYKHGFGSLAKDFWLGNEQLYHLTKQKRYELRVDLVTSDNSPLLQKYPAFGIANETENYALMMEKGSSARTGMVFNIGLDFSTFDRDNDRCERYNCAQQQRGAWWYGVSTWCTGCYWNECGVFLNDNCYSSCTDSNLNGDYNGGNGQTIIWYKNAAGRYCNMKYADMKIRPSL